ncbi:CHASE2 domain-containing protein [Calothrix sp. NIES-2098]|uniref:CHASE2 domain-containing protein n=1 Tax=Calothrix sp. NIES-2098 TaxID=1954171 RepID=UPI000B613CA1|nr:WD-40 repeat-containing protein [Calothrix sp. NIES-2098]
MSNPTIYTVGGTVQAGGGIYIPRQADEELLSLCRSATFAYVLTPRQMGKSSLMVRTAERLNDEGIQTVMIDLTQIGTQVSAEAWYLGLLTIMEDQLMLDTNVVQWWQAYSYLGVTQRLTLFFEKVLLAEVQERVVMFVDEIDTTLSLDFTDDFYTAIRYLYIARAINPEFQRLTSVLIGVATPGDLIRDAKRTPFNIGQRVDLTDFTFKEALPLADGLGLPTEEAKQVLQWVLKWTGGHPYLTQRLCGALLEEVNRETDNTKELSKFLHMKITEKDVDRIVSNTFFGVMSQQDNNLQFVRDMLTKRAPDLFGVLTTYREIIRGKCTVLDEEQSLFKSHLKLSGIVRCENTRLYVRNLIYKKVFDHRWLKEYLPVPMKALKVQRVLVTSLVVTLLALGVRHFKVLQSWELKVYDQMLRSRPLENLDHRILLVTITEEDLARENWPLSDETINKLLHKLESYQPRVIGLNLYRPGQKNFAIGLASHNNIIGTCLFSSIRRQEIPPPPTLSIDYVGYTDLIPDSEDDQFVRRALLFAQSTDKKCRTQFSFAALVAISYLEKAGLELDFPDKYHFSVGKNIFPILTSNFGSYQQLDAQGYQIMLNYRNSTQVAQEVTLTQVLTNQVSPKQIKDRLIIIGTTASSIHPGLYTPYSVSPQQAARTPPVLIHAQIASQIISTVLDKRPLIWDWPDWAEFLWIWGWSLLGGVLGSWLRNFWLIAVVEGITLLCLVGICAGLFFQAGWVPLIPSALVLIITTGSLLASPATLKQQQHIKFTKSMLDKKI